MIFRKVAAGEASSKIASQCMTNGLTVVSSTAGEVTCQLQMNAMKSALTQALIGNSYSTPPQTFVRFTVTQIGNDARVQANEWVETQMAFGQMRRSDLTNDDVHNDLMNFLEVAGASYLPGTSFPNHAYLGAFGGGTMVDYKGKSTAGIKLSGAAKEGALVKAGTIDGDILVAINGKTFKTNHEVEKRLKGIALDSPMNVTVIREGKALTLNTTALRRPTIAPSTDVAAAFTPASDQGNPVTSIAQTDRRSVSVADEITKLLALKDKGILTDAEFQVQKASLLKAQ